jgi:prepilin-type N-terminal cleavage/methylation domain-containing protein
MKRGFNLIELAVVFLLIGLISAMVYKGKELLDTASIKADVNKISKLRNAVAAVMMMTAKGNIDEFKYIDNQTGYDLKQFFTLDLLSREDLAVQGTSNTWALFPCINRADNFSFDIENVSGTMICALHKTYPLDVLCNTELMSDNQDLGSGNGVAFTDSGAKTPVTGDFSGIGMAKDNFDCHLARPSSTNIPKTYGFILYR